MFPANNWSSPGGLYKQLTVFHHASLWGVQSLTWYDWINLIVSATTLLAFCWSRSRMCITTHGIEKVKLMLTRQWIFIYYISPVFTQHIKSVALSLNRHTNWCTHLILYWNFVKTFLKLFEKCSDMFRSFDRHQGAVRSLLKLNC